MQLCRGLPLICVILFAGFTLSVRFAAEFILSRVGFLGEFTLSEMLRSLCSLRMTENEGLRWTGSGGLRVTPAKGSLKMTEAKVSE